MSETLKLQDRIKTIELDLLRSQASYERVLKDKESTASQVNDLKLLVSRAREANESLGRENDTLIGKIGSLQEQNESLQIRLEETSERVSQLSVGPLKIAVKELNNEKSLLQAKIKQLELANVQETLLRQKLTGDFEELVQQNIKLSNEVQELEKKLRKVRHMHFDMAQLTCALIYRRLKRTLKSKRNVSLWILNRNPSSYN